MSFIEGIVSELSPAKLGKHISSYVDMYVKPMKVWKKCLSNRKDAYDMIIAQIVYYTLITIFLISDFRLGIIAAIFDILYTIVPFIILYIPFKIFITVTNKKIQAKSLFRLFLIIKLQVLPIAVAIFIFAIASKIESLFIVANNLGSLLPLFFISVLPFIVSIKIWQKAVFILVNYIFYASSLIFLFYVSSKVPSITEVGNNFVIQTPNSELEKFEYDLYNSSQIYLVRDYCLFLGKFDGSDYKIIRGQHVSEDLFAIAIQALDHNRRSNYYKEDKSVPYSKFSYKALFINKNILTVQLLDSLKSRNDKIYNDNIRLIKLYRDSCFFDSNRKYFSQLLDLYQLDSALVEKVSLMKSTINSGELLCTIETNDSFDVLLINIKDKKHLEKNTSIDLIRSAFTKREHYTNFVFDLMFKPILILSDYLIE